MRTTSSPKWYRDAVILAKLSQIAAVGLVVVVLAVLVRNAALNMGARGILIDPGFLWSTAPFKVGFTPFFDFVPGQTRYWEVFAIGVHNTLLVADAGIFSSTMLGLLIGVMRLSSNLLARRIASAYIETFRNLPLLLQVFFWHFIVILPALPARQHSVIVGSAGMLNREGVFLSLVNFGRPLFACLAMALAVVAVIFIMRWSRAPERSGHQVAAASAAFVLGIAGLLWFSNLDVDPPQLARMGVVGASGYLSP